MQLTENYGAPKDLHEADWFRWLWNHLVTEGKINDAGVETHFIDLAAALAERGQIDLAVASIIEISQRFDMTMARFYQVCLGLANRNPEFLSTSLMSYYLRQGGAERWAYEVEISRNFSADLYSNVIQLFNASKQWFDWREFQTATLFLVSNAFLFQEKMDACYEIMDFLVTVEPDTEAFQRNMLLMATRHKFRKANNHYQKITRDYARFFSEFTTKSDAAAEFILDLPQHGESEIIHALAQFGLCHVRNGCVPQIIEEILSHVVTLDDALFPTSVTDFVTERAHALLRFDAAAVMNAVLRRPSVLDAESCVIRKVDPGNARSFTPFHQDSTAFMKPIVNIWVPLTPAGGAYPTIEFVKRKLANAHDTVASTDEYHLVKIDDAEVLSRYQGEFYEATDVSPGDCIIFLGTTIHRSTNLSAATKTRYNLELRWS